jgi:hypothetical protein
VANALIASWTERQREYNIYKMEAGPSGHCSGHSYAAKAMEVDETKVDLVGEPYAVVESDPGSFVFSRAVNINVTCIFRRIYINHTTA